MDRKKAIIGAATVAGSLLAASSAYALTSGIVGNGGDDGAGNLNPVLDVAPTDESTTTVLATATDGPQSNPNDDNVSGDDVDVGPTTPQVGDDSSDDEAEAEAEDHDGVDDHDDDAVEPHEYEGREDDD